MIKFVYGEKTDAILAAYFRVLHRLYNRLGYSEESVAAALAIELRESGFKVREQVSLFRTYKGRQIGIEYADLIVDDLIVIEVKKVARINRTHIAQLHTYLEDAGLAVGLILNFGADHSNGMIKRVFVAENAPEGYLNA